MLSVVYKVLDSKVINGSLFYAMDYFLVANEIATVQLLYICDDRTFNFILSVLKVKYEIPTYLINHIKHCKYTELPTLINNNVLFVDVKSYMKCKDLIKYKKFIYSSYGNNDLSDNTYGWYDYQNFKTKVRLKLALTYYKIYDEIYDTFTSAASGMLINNPKGVTKHPNMFLNLMEYKTWNYVHNGFDTNNRFIPEARYFNKILLITHSKVIFNDSINDILETPIEYLILTKDDKLIKDFSNG